MIVHPASQGSIQWKQAKLGVPSASRFDEIITAAGKPSKSAKRYLCDLIVEYFLRQPASERSSQFMDRGKELEPEARAWYEWTREVAVQQVGFCTLDDGSAGCSPDGLVGDDGLIEIKCFEVTHHVAAALKQDAEYFVQVQGNLWIMERAWCDRIYYSPCFPPVQPRFERDEGFIAKLADRVSLFVADLRNAISYLEGKGWRRRELPDTEGMKSDLDEFDRCVAAAMEQRP